ncbi:protein POLYCHOME-like protein [Cinnamomum micranthum f. kanehirae]|uniref:Protein POLYCHOME-like protein n=1 Tax=Cinnamomum micranthum f. kanehirae TaxID=337451 RepID=A0A3S3MCB4_9MAGN|nr:protein POLYCHOME-like protein [Cinnamomum micranthum f. kanehirae]
MPEARDRLGRVGDEDLALGFFIGSRPRVLYPFDNKENVSPEFPSSRRRRTSRRKSPLPSWYPRTPLRDITAVVNAMQRRRDRLREAAELRRRNQEVANSSPSPSPTSPLAHELSDSEEAPPPTQDQEITTIVSDLSPDPLAMTTTSLQPIDKKSVAADRKLSDSIDDICVAADNNSVSIGGICVAADKDFSDSVEKIERIVKENIQRISKKTTKKLERSTLLSMR